MKKSALVLALVVVALVAYNSLVYEPAKKRKHALAVAAWEARQAVEAERVAALQRSESSRHETAAMVRSEIEAARKAAESAEATAKIYAAVQAELKGGAEQGAAGRDTDAMARADAEADRKAAQSAHATAKIYAAVQEEMQSDAGNERRVAEPARAAADKWGRTPAQVEADYQAYVAKMLAEHKAEQEARAKAKADAEAMAKVEQEAKAAAWAAWLQAQRRSGNPASTENLRAQGAQSWIYEDTPKKRRPSSGGSVHVFETIPGHWQYSSGSGASGQIIETLPGSYMVIPQ